MKFKDVISRVKGRVEKTREDLRKQRSQARTALRNLKDNFGDDFVDRAFNKARENLAPSNEQLPVDFQLRQSNLLRRLYERIFPVSHVSKIGYRYGREFLDDFMPVSNEAYIGRGSYKFVYKLPWSIVVKVSRHVWPSDPLFGSLYKEVVKNPERFFTEEENALRDHLLKISPSYKKESINHKFYRLGLEKYHYWKVREAIPDLALPTKYFMGMRYRRRPFSSGFYETLTPMDTQIMLAGKHLKEFAKAGKPEKQNFISRRLLPRYQFEFDGARFGRVKKNILIQIKEDFQRLIDFTRRLAKDEKLILDIHSENIIITLPEFHLRVFDFHLFDEHLYADAYTGGNSEKELIEVIEKFVDSLDLHD
ncbi:MAG: hypothetical protein OEZ34_15060 [Spirochaetia bacterium]|nr:hypothetical protein [Spirochaetia bacterium]